MRPLVSLDDEGPQAASAPPGWLTPAVGALAALDLVVFAGALLHGAVLKPYSDTYRFIFDAWRWRDGAQSFPAYLWEPHVGHHMAWVRLLTAWEVVGPHSTWPSVAACTLCLVLSAMVVAMRAGADARLSHLRGASALLCGMLVLTSFNALDANQPLNAPYAPCLLFALLSLSLWTREGGVFVRMGALLAAVAAALSNGAALALWPVLAILAAVSPWRRRWIWATAAAAAGVVFGAAYLSGAGQIAELGAGGGGADTSPVRRVLYLLDYVALPWSQMSALAGAVLGAALLGLSAWAIHVSRLRGPTSLDRFAWSLIGFTALTAVLAALGRGGLGEDLRAPVRYAVFAAPLQIGLVMLLAPEVERRFASRGWLIAAIALSAAGLLLLLQAAGAVFVSRSAATVRATIDAYEMGRTTPLTTQLIYPDLVFVGRVEARLRAERSFGKAPQELAHGSASAQGRTP